MFFLGGQLGDLEERIGLSDGLAPIGEFYNDLPTVGVVPTVIVAVVYVQEHVPIIVDLFDAAHATSVEDQHPHGGVGQGSYLHGISPQLMVSGAAWVAVGTGMV